MSRIDADVAQHVVDKLVERAVRNTAEKVRYVALNAFGDTPIEKALFAACWSSVEHTDNPFSGLRFVADLSGFDRPELDGRFIVMSIQTVVTDWPVDFLFTVKGADGERRDLVVECDGHDFHERTKEQAARDRRRDRDLQARGFTIFRFTGFEIFKDPCGCGDAIVRWATEAVA